MTVLYVLWQNPMSRRWLPVGQLSKPDTDFEFRYTKGADIDAGFVPFGRMNDLDEIYRSKILFPLFSNRILAESRPERVEFLEWLDVANESSEPIDILARTGGTRATDQLVLYPKPMPNSAGRYETNFFCHGLRYIDEAAAARIATMKTGDPLFPMYDVRNTADTDAVAIRSNDPSMLLGYVPRPLARDARACIDGSLPSRMDFRVRRVNPDAPLQFRLLCRLETDWPTGFAPCSDEAYQLREKSAPPASREVA